MTKLIIRLLGNPDSTAYRQAAEIITRCGHTLIEGGDDACHLAIAPLLTRKLTDAELCNPIIGTLIFHPSPLPYGRGSSAIRHAYNRREPLSAATWFWADSTLDGGDICGSEIIRIDYLLRPREFYEKHILPAMQRTLLRVITDIVSNHINRIKQVSQYASYDPKV